MKENTVDEKVDLAAIKTPDELFELASSERIKMEQMKTLIEMHPGIVQASIEALQAIGATSQVAGNSQVEAIKTIREAITGSVDVLKILAQNAQSDSSREKIAELLIELSKQHKELCLLIEKMNKTNNKFWKKVAITIGGILTLVAGGAAAAAALKK